MNNSNDIQDIAIVGGGLAGLAVAAYARRAGLDTVVLERRSRLGGRAETRRLGDFALNRGAHALYRRGEAAEVLAELGVSHAGAAPRGRMLAARGDELDTLPTGPASLLVTRLLGLRAKWEMGTVLAALPGCDVASLRGMSCTEWIRRTVETPEARALLRSLLRLATFVGRLDDLDAATGVGQLVKGTGGVEYLHGGWGTLVDHLEDRVRAEGASLHLSSRVTSVLRRPDGSYEVACGERTVIARTVVLALPRRDALPLLESLGVMRHTGDAAPARCAALDVCLDRLPHPDRTFALGIDRPVYLSVHSAFARLAPPGGAVVQLVRYDDGTEFDADRNRAELENLLDRVQPGWRRVLVEQRFLPSLEAATRIDVAAELGIEGRPSVEAAKNLYLVGDWVGRGSWLSDASLASARTVGKLVAARSRGEAAA